MKMTMLRRYKEIIYGGALGVLMWVLDAAMHARLGAEVHSSGFADELLRPGATQFGFRAAFVVVATAFGWALWRANWRERELRALEAAIIAFHRQLDSPAMRLISHARMLQGRPAVARDEFARRAVEAIGEDARAVDELARQYLNFSEQVMAGRTGEAIQTLRAIEAWTARAAATTTTAAVTDKGQTPPLA